MAANYYIDYVNGTDTNTGLKYTDYTVDSTADTTHFVDAALHGICTVGCYIWVTGRSGSLVTAFNDTTHEVTLGTAIVGLTAGDLYYMLASYKTINQYTKAGAARVVGDVGYVRANQTHDSHLAHIGFDESGTAAGYISLIGCDSVTNDPWHDASDTRPIIDFMDANFEVYMPTRNYWYIANLDFCQSAQANGCVASSTCTGNWFNNCIFRDTSNAAGLGINATSSVKLKFTNCIFKDNLVTSVLLSASEAIIDGCTFDGGATTTDYGIQATAGASLVTNCTFGSTTAHDLQDIYVSNRAAYVKCINCTFNKATLSVNISGAGSYIASEDDDGTFGQQIVYYENGTVTKDATARVGGASSSAKLMPVSATECGVCNPLSITPYTDYDFKVYLLAGVHTVTIYMRSVTTWGGVYPTAAQCYVTFSYLSNGASAARTTVTTDEVFSDATTWVAFDSGNITTARDGWCYIKVYLGKYVAANGIYVDIKPVIT